MSSISINSINGSPPYQVFICDVNQLVCVSAATITTTVPPNVLLKIPPPYDVSPEVLIKVIDSTGCQFTNVYSCLIPSTPRPTPSITPTTSITPSVTPTPGTPTPTPTITPTMTVTPTLTPSTTPTPTVTRTPDPTPPSRPQRALLFIEPYSGATNIGQYMYNLGHDFYGFTNGTQPSRVLSAFTGQMISYVEFSGWTSGNFPRILEISVPQGDGGGVDSFGNPVFRNNFPTTMITANTISGQAWYTWLIPTGVTDNLIQTEIELSLDNPNVFVTNKTEPSIYQLTFDYSGAYIPTGTYRVYTTYPSLNFQLFDNQNIYFKGGTVE